MMPISSFFGFIFISDLTLDSFVPDGSMATTVWRLTSGTGSSMR